MPITCYTGLPRSGKSYQVVSHVICAALRQGRRVVTNISGLQEQAIHDYLIADGVAPASLGHIVQVEHDEVMAPHFFRTDNDIEESIEAFIQPGDLLCLDEVWRFWEQRGKIPDRHLNFFRMHGHFAHPESGLICEVALISQSVADINEHIRRVVFETYRMTKDTAVGSNKSFLVQVFARGSEAKSAEIRRFKGLYNKKFFEFYKSHSQAAEGTIPKEDTVDKRGNILKGALFKYVIPLMLIAAVFAGNQVWSFFHPVVKSKVPAVAEKSPALGGPPAVSPSSLSSQWRLIGWSKHGLDSVALLESSSGVRVVRYPQKWQLNRYASEGLLDGDKVAAWTGAGGVLSTTAHEMQPK